MKGIVSIIIAVIFTCPLYAQKAPSSLLEQGVRRRRKASHYNFGGSKITGCLFHALGKMKFFI
jgi:hypothetical protein